MVHPFLELENPADPKPGRPRPKYILVEPYCILCRQDRESIPVFLRAVRGWPACKYEIPGPWRSKVLLCELVGRAPEAQGRPPADSVRATVFQIPSIRNPALERTFSCSLEAPIEGVMPIPLPDHIRQELDEAGWEIACEPMNEDVDLERTANIIHMPCLQLARLRLPQLNARLLCHIAKLLQPVVAWIKADHLIDKYSHLTSLPLPDPSSSTELALLLLKALKMPAEIQALIGKYIPWGFFSALARSSVTLSWISQHLLSHAIGPQPWLQETPMSAYSNIEILGANMVDVLGEECLATVGAKSSVAYHRQIHVQTKEIHGIAFALGSYGVVGLRVHYDDRSQSPWLGRSSPWTKYIRGSDLQKLLVLSDSLKVLSLSFKPDGKLQLESKETAHVLWGQEVVRLACQTKILFMDLKGSAAVPVRGNPGTSYARQIPLTFDDGKRHSLTVSYNKLGITNLQIDGSEKQLNESPLAISCPITFYLRPHETVQSLHILNRSSAGFYLGMFPYILVTTSLKRCLYYGPYMDEEVWARGPRISSFGHHTTHSPIALFTDLINADVEGKMSSLGVILAPRSHGAEQPEPILSVPVSVNQRSRFFTKTRDEAFVTKAAFSEAVAIYVQRFAGHCFGLMAETRDGEALILGRWNPGKSERTDNLYEEKDGPLNSITFVYRVNRLGNQWVTDVLINDTEMPGPPRHFTWHDLSKELAWYFDPISDSIDYWNGRDETLRPDSNGEFKVVAVGSE